MFLLNFIPWYLGNKSKLLHIIEKEINSISKQWDTICDLFAWSGVIWDYFKNNYNIISNDIEYYSYIINEVNINFDKKELLKLNLNDIVNNLKNEIDNTWLKQEIWDITEYLNKLWKRKKKKENFFYSNFVWTYFSVNQWLEIDLYRLNIEKNYKWFTRSYLIALWIYGLYNVVNSVWNHFAQPRWIKDKNLAIIKKKFQKSFFDVVIKKHNEILKNIDWINSFSSKNISENLDYKDFLKKWHKINTFYIDTPYTIDHYSRFYHILNTFSKYDYPKVEWIWLYREDRFQSPFCLKTKVEEEFEYMISTVFKKYNANIVLSYSDSYRSLLHKDKILEIFKRYYKDVKLEEIKYNYSWLWQGSWNNCNELLFTAKI